MIRLTLTDGTRIQLPAAEISAVEPVAAGALVYRTSGEVLTVQQDFRTVETRVHAAWAMTARAAAPQAAQAEPALTPQPLAELPMRRSETPSHRRKRLLLGRTSSAAIFIARRLR